MKKIRIGSGAGYAGDRIEPAIDLMKRGELDYIIFECLAERTVSCGQMDKAADPSKGYNRLLDYRMREILPLVKAHKCRVVTNMGAANTRAAAYRTMELAKELGVQGIKIAYVEGDDITEALNLYQDNEVLETKRSLKEMEITPISANAYMGADGIVEALKQGADIVITGRVSDPALTIGPLMYEFGWNLESNPDQIGQAVIAGHLLECAGQVTGGYFADPGYKDVPELWNLGFPFLEIEEDGSFVVTKLEKTGGIVTKDTVKEQIIYEIHNPTAYMTPDAIADFTTIKLEECGENRIKVSGATTHGKPDTLKVSIGYRDCYISSGSISYGGSNACERAKLAIRVLKERFRMIGLNASEMRYDLIGYNSLYGNTIADAVSVQPCSYPEVRVRVAGRFEKEADAQILCNEVEALYTNGPAGGGGVEAKVEQIVSICSIFVPRESIDVSVCCLEV